MASPTPTTQPGSSYQPVRPAWTVDLDLEKPVGVAPPAAPGGGAGDRNRKCWQLKKKKEGPLRFEDIWGGGGEVGGVQGARTN
jgi:hypothetical protein